MTGWRERVDQAAAVLRDRLGPLPERAVILGSGLGAIAERLQESASIPFADVPHLPTTGVAGHAGVFRIGRLGPTTIVIQQGRLHSYEGHGLDVICFPVRVLARAGVKSFVLTAATGGIAPGLAPGDLVLISDHLNLLGANPLRGPNESEWGPRFPDMTEVYSTSWRRRARQAADELGIALREGIYAALPGPSYETPAEIRMLRGFGADVVGMSVVPEAIAARHLGLDVLGLALVTNAAAGLGDAPLSHAEVMAESARAAETLGDLIERLV